RHHGRAGGRLALLLQRDAHPGRPHGRRALAARPGAVRRRGPAVRREPRWLYADGDRRLRRPLGRVLLLPAHGRVAAWAAQPPPPARRRAAALATAADVRRG